jgi:RHS repeat-associated protein
MANRCFYLHDRLGSVRQIISYDNNLVLNSYTYGPFGQTVEQSSSGTVTNSFMFTGQYYDFEISQYYLRARQYDPQLMRFTGRDPIKGKYKEPLTLHKYLYCNNDSVNRQDPSGLFFSEIWEWLKNVLGIAGHTGAVTDGGGAALNGAVEVLSYRAVIASECNDPDFVMSEKYKKLSRISQTPGEEP